MPKTTHARIPIDTLRLARDLNAGADHESISHTLTVALDVLRAVLVELGDVSPDVAPLTGFGTKHDTSAGHGFLDALRKTWDDRDVVRELADVRSDAARYRAKLNKIREIADVS